MNCDSNPFWVALQSNQLADAVYGVEDDFKEAIEDIKEDWTRIDGFFCNWYQTCETKSTSFTSKLKIMLLFQCKHASQNKSPEQILWESFQCSSKLEMVLIV